MKTIARTQMCCVCHRVRSDCGWRRMEALEDGQGVGAFSHGYCPTCFKKACDAIPSDLRTLHLQLVG